MIEKFFKASYFDFKIKKEFCICKSYRKTKVIFVTIILVKWVRSFLMPQMHFGKVQSDQEYTITIWQEQSRQKFPAFFDIIYCGKIPFYLIWIDS